MEQENRVFLCSNQRVHLLTGTQRTDAERIRPKLFVGYSSSFRTYLDVIGVRSAQKVEEHFSMLLNTVDVSIVNDCTPSAPPCPLKGSCTG